MIVKATDALGHVGTKEITFTTGDKVAPNVNLSGLPAESSGATYADYWESFGSSGVGAGQFSHPAGMAVDSTGNLWVVDGDNGRVEKFNEAGEYLGSLGSPGAGNGQLSRPTDAAVDSEGNLWVADTGNSRVEEFSGNGAYLGQFGSEGSAPGQLKEPYGIAVDAKDNIWVSDTLNSRVEKFTHGGEFVASVGSPGAGDGQFNFSAGVAIAPDGDLWVADWGNSRIEEFTEAGEYVAQFGSEGTGEVQFAHPDAVDVDGYGSVWVTDTGNDRIEGLNQAGEYVTEFGTPGSGKGQLDLGVPVGIAANSKGSLWVADGENDRVQRWLAPNATVTGQLDPIEAAATDAGFGVSSVTAELTSESGETEILGETTQSCSKGQCPLSLSLPEPDLSEKPAGSYVLTFSATDEAGHVRRVDKVIGLDPTPPTISLSGTLAERANKPLNEPSGDLTIEASDPAGSGVKTINVERDHQRVATYPYDCAGNCGDVTASYRYSAARDGTERSVQDPPEPPGSTATSLSGVSCVNTGNCVAVGYQVDETGGTWPLAEHWNGSEWLVKSPPVPPETNNNRLDDVSCPSEGFCFAAATLYSYQTWAYVDVWDGSNWLLGGIPNNESTELSGVSCTSSTDCTVVGTKVEGGGVSPFTAHWNGSKWSTEEPPVPAETNNSRLSDVECPSVNFCFATANLYWAGSSWAYAEIWDGSSWSALGGIPENGGMELRAVSCVAIDDCTAVGSRPRGGHTAPAIVRWDGSSWSVDDSVDPAGIIEEEGSQAASPVGVLESVSCTSSMSCTAFGSYRSMAQETQPLAESWDGTEWALQPAPDPTESGDAETNDASCSSGFACVAVGSYDESGTHALIESQAPSEDSHRITVEAIDKYGATAVKSIDVDVPDEVAETPACSQETTSVAPKEPVSAPEAVAEIESTLPRAVATSVPMTEETTEDEIDPSYTPPQPNLESTGNLAEGETSVSPEGGVTLAGVACITPSSVTTAATGASVVHEDSAVFANTAPETSTIVRPTSGGASVIQAVEGPEAPEGFSWNVTVPVGTELEKLPSGAIAIVNATEEEGEGVAELPEPEGAMTTEALNDAATQLETDEYQLASAQAETDHEVLAVIAEPWVVLRTNIIVPAPIEVVPDVEIPTEYEIHVIMPADEEQAQFFPVFLRLDVTASVVKNGHCDGRSPCGDYDALAANLYATYWGTEHHVNAFGEKARNPGYHNYGDNNCTNFLSQIIRAGNVKFMRAFDHADGSWWYHNNFPGGQRVPPEGVGWDSTESWRLADKLPRHLWQYGLAHIDRVQQPWGWTRGDILAEDWFGTNGKGDFNHLQYVVGTTNAAGHAREPLIANESSPGRNYPSLIWWQVRRRIQEAEGEPGWTRAALAMKHTKANLHDKKHDPDNLYNSNGLFRG